MSDSFLAGLVVGAIAGGFIGALALAAVASGSEPYRDAADEDRLFVPRSASVSVSARSSLSVNLLPDALPLNRSREPVVTDDDIDREMSELVRRFGTPSGS